MVSESLISYITVNVFVLISQAFVESNPNLKWCPFPECDNAVQLPEHQSREYFIGFDAVSETAPLVVDCGNEHFFCW